LAGVLVSIRSALAEVATLSAQQADISKRVVLDGDPDPGAVRYKTIIVAASTDRIDVAVRREDPCFIMYTSGTTGYPEGVVLTHDTVTFEVLNPIIDLDLGSDEVSLVIAPLFHTGALNYVALPCGDRPEAGHRWRLTLLHRRPLPKAAIFAKNGARAAATNVLHYLGKTEANAVLSGERYCYIDTGGGASAQGKGNFFALPHPAIHLTSPSVELHHDKQEEERDWRAIWEHDASLPG
jgi:AMP-binding enzyme